MRAVIELGELDVKRTRGGKDLKQTSIRPRLEERNMRVAEVLDDYGTRVL